MMKSNPLFLSPPVLLCFLLFFSTNHLLVTAAQLPDVCIVRTGLKQEMDIKVWRAEEEMHTLHRVWRCYTLGPVIEGDIHISCGSDRVFRQSQTVFV